MTVFVSAVCLCRTSMPSATVLLWNISAHSITMQASSTLHTSDSLHVHFISVLMKCPVKTSQCCVLYCCKWPIIAGPVLDVAA